MLTQERVEETSKQRERERERERELHSCLPSFPMIESNVHSSYGTVEPVMVKRWLVKCTKCTQTGISTHLLRWRERERKRKREGERERERRVHFTRQMPGRTKYSKVNYHANVEFVCVFNGKFSCSFNCISLPLSHFLILFVFCLTRAIGKHTKVTSIDK